MKTKLRHPIHHEPNLQSGESQNPSDAMTNCSHSRGGGHIAKFFFFFFFFYHKRKKNSSLMLAFSKAAAG
jgi:hypothetical protein